MLTLTDISKSYATGETVLKVLEGASLELRVGDFCVLSGPSGSGKSTLLNIIGCLDSPDAGKVRVDHIDVSRLSDARTARLRNTTFGFIFQSFHLIPVLTAAENVAYPLFIQGVGKASRMHLARELLDEVGLGDFTERLPAKLSGGQCQRVAIARALACDPRLVLADEPTANLDRDTAAGIMELLARLNRQAQVTFFIATHDPLVARYATRHFALEAGKVVEQEGEMQAREQAAAPAPASASAHTPQEQPHV